tara:strand:- start:352 stop:930 length:579 start_codon:yes stop_codon:yes gene_type:complete
MNIKEEWKPVKGFEGKYSISNKGNIFHHNGKRSKLLKLDTSGECISIKLFKDGKKKHFTLTTLMRTHWRFEFIFDLEDDECVKEFYGYFVTSKGRIWSPSLYRWLTPTPAKNYYWTVNMKINGKYTPQTIHKLVGRLFLNGYRKGLHICHKKEYLSYPEINYSDNLFVGTHADNMNDMREKGRSRNRFSVIS